MAGTGYELTVIASMLTGGASLSAALARSSAPRSAASSYIQQIVIGVIVPAVAFDGFAKSRRRRI